ncbi:hypothetical protein AOA12_01160 [Microbacterium sp. No. 7]|nr:hypothetical protein AOA12_01160 [Microbacterium sp. No. 7]
MRRPELTPAPDTSPPADHPGPGRPRLIGGSRLSVGPHAVPAGVAVIARTYRSVPPLTVDIDGNQVSADPETPQNRMIDRVFNLNAMLPAGE